MLKSSGLRTLIRLTGLVALFMRINKKESAIDLLQLTKQLYIIQVHNFFQHSLQLFNTLGPALNKFMPLYENVIDQAVNHICTTCNS
jgi:hypothetical protein